MCLTGKKAPVPTFSQPEKWSPVFQDFISNCLVQSPDQRPSALMLLNHEFVREVNSIHHLHRFYSLSRSLFASV